MEHRQDVICAKWKIKSQGFTSVPGDHRAWAPAVTDPAEPMLRVMNGDPHPQAGISAAAYGNFLLSDTLFRGVSVSECCAIIKLRSAENSWPEVRTRGEWFRIHFSGRGVSHAVWKEKARRSTGTGLRAAGEYGGSALKRAPRRLRKPCSGRRKLVRKFDGEALYWPRRLVEGETGLVLRTELSRPDCFLVSMDTLPDASPTWPCKQTGVNHGSDRRRPY